MQALLQTTATTSTGRNTVICADYSCLQVTSVHTEGSQHVCTMLCTEVLTTLQTQKQDTYAATCHTSENSNTAGRQESREPRLSRR